MEKLVARGNTSQSHNKAVEEDKQMMYLTALM